MSGTESSLLSLSPFEEERFGFIYILGWFSSREPVEYRTPKEGSDRRPSFPVPLFRYPLETPPPHLPVLVRSRSGQSHGESRVTGQSNSTGPVPFPSFRPQVLVLRGDGVVHYSEGISLNHSYVFFTQPYFLGKKQQEKENAVRVYDDCSPSSEFATR